MHWKEENITMKVHAYHWQNRKNQKPFFLFVHHNKIYQVTGNLVKKNAYMKHNWATKISSKWKVVNKQEKLNIKTLLTPFSDLFNRITKMQTNNHILYSTFVSNHIYPSYMSLILQHCSLKIKSRRLCSFWLPKLYSVNNVNKPLKTTSTWT